MVIQINFKSGTPAYLQIVDQVKMAAASGGLRPGEPLPSIRPLAEQLRLNRNTVARAYLELEQQGVIETRQGRGCFLKESQSPLKKAARIERLCHDIDAAIVQAHHLQVDDPEFIALVRERLAHFVTANKRHDQEKP